MLCISDTNSSFDCVTSTFVSGHPLSYIIVTFDSKDYPDVWGYYVEATYYWDSGVNTFIHTYTSTITFGIDTKGPLLLGVKTDYHCNGVYHDKLYYTLFDMGIGKTKVALNDETFTNTYTFTNTLTNTLNPRIY